MTLEWKAQEAMRLQAVLVEMFASFPSGAVLAIGPKGSTTYTRMLTRHAERLRDAGTFAPGSLEFRLLVAVEELLAAANRADGLVGHRMLASNETPGRLHCELRELVGLFPSLTLEHAA